MPSSLCRLVAICGSIFIVTFFLVVILHYNWQSLPFKDYDAAAWAAVAAFFSVIVAVIALFTSWRQIEESKKAARLSVEPSCQITPVGKNDEKHDFGLFLKNEGLGPAKVLEWSFFIKGEEIPERNDMGFVRLIRHYQLQDYAHRYPMPRGSSIAATKQEALLHIPHAVGDLAVIGTGKEANETMMQLMREVNVRLRYASAYKDEFATESNPDSLPVSLRLPQ